MVIWRRSFRSFAIRTRSGSCASELISGSSRRKLPSVQSLPGPLRWYPRRRRDPSTSVVATSTPAFGRRPAGPHPSGRQEVSRDAGGRRWQRAPVLAQRPGRATDSSRRPSSSAVELPWCPSPGRWTSPPWGASSARCERAAEDRTGELIVDLTRLQLLRRRGAQGSRRDQGAPGPFQPGARARDLRHRPSFRYSRSPAWTSDSRSIRHWTRPWTAWPAPMSSWRDRESETQVRSRVANESTARAKAGAPAGRVGSFRCECGDRNCPARSCSPLSEYEAVRAYDTHFAIAHNHENPEREGLIEEHEHFTVVETVSGEAVKRARRTGRGSVIGGFKGPGSDGPPRLRHVRGGGGSPARFASAAGRGHRAAERAVARGTRCPRPPSLPGMRHRRRPATRTGSTEAASSTTRPAPSAAGGAHEPRRRRARAWALLAVPVQVVLFIDHVVNRPSTPRHVVPARLTHVGSVLPPPREGRR